MHRITKEPGYFAVDLHVHTIYSKDSLTGLSNLIESVQQRGLTSLAITDHNTVEGALRLRDIAPFPVIVGEEIRTCYGEISGLFIEHEIPRGLSPQETIAAIHEQGGLVYLPHPADSVRRSVLRQASVMAIIEQVDIIEVYNSRVLTNRDNRAAANLADTYHIAHGAGSDAHTPHEVGNAYVLIPQCDLTDATSFLAAIREGTVTGNLSNPLVHLSSTVAKIVKRLGLYQQ